MPSQPLIVTVAGGKGGVGKSMMSANLAVLLAQSGASTVLVDADLGAPNQHTFFGCERVATTMGDFLEGRVRSLAETFVPTGIARLSLVAGQTGVAGAANPPHARKLKLARAIAQLDAEVVVVDLGAGMSHNVVDLFLLGHLRYLVVAPQLTAVQNAYGFAKTALLRSFSGLGVNARQSEALAAAFERRALARIEEGIALLDAGEPELAKKCRGATVGFGVELVGNLVEGPRSVSILQALSRMMRDYLHVSAPVSALVPRSEALHQSVNARAVLAQHAPHDPALRSLRALAERITTTDRSALLSQRASASQWPQQLEGRTTPAPPLPVTPAPFRPSRAPRPSMAPSARVRASLQPRSG